MTPRREVIGDAELWLALVERARRIDRELTCLVNEDPENAETNCINFIAAALAYAQNEAYERCGKWHDKREEELRAQADKYPKNDSRYIDSLHGALTHRAAAIAVRDLACQEEDQQRERENANRLC